MTKRVTATLVICLMGATTAGIALARPASTNTVAAAAPAPGSAPSSESANGYGQTGSGSQAQQGAVATRTIVIDQFAFSGDTTVSAGQNVAVSNLDGSAHTLTSSDGLFDTGTLASGGGAGSFVAPTAPGTYAFFCAIHPSMTGTLTVAG